MKLYLISGLGADERVFRKLDLGSHQLVHICWKRLADGENLQDYCARLAAEIDTSEPFALGGLSLGGICAQEMTRFVTPEKLILISTIKNRQEMSPIYRAASATRLQELLPDGFFKWAAFHSTAAIGATNDEDVFQEMLAHTEERFFKWAIKAIAAWEGVSYDLPLLHLHGDADKVFPIEYIHQPVVIKGGTHYMVVNQAHGVSEKISRFLDPPRENN